MSVHIAGKFLQLSEFDVTFVTPKGLRRQVLSDSFAKFPPGECEHLYAHLPASRFVLLRTANGALIIALMVHSVIKKPGQAS